MGIAIGIALGTTRSSCAFVSNGKPRMLTTSDGARSFPPGFAVGEQRVRRVDAVELGAALRRIKAAAEAALGDEVHGAVLTVPASFDERERDAVRSAGGLAGLRVLYVVGERQAAAKAHALGLGPATTQRVAVYNLGHRTFELSILDIGHRTASVLATGGDTFGGVDFDLRLTRWALQEFARQSGVDLSGDPSAVGRLRDACEQAKIRLSTETETELSVERIGLRLSVTRAQLEALTGELVDRSIAVCERILREAGTTWGALDQALLVGGPSRMPLVRSRLGAFVATPEGFSPDEVVAIGAAMVADGWSGTPSEWMGMLEPLPMAIAVDTGDGAMRELFARYSPMPDFKTRVVTTSRDDQRSIVLRIYRGGSNDAAENELVDTFSLSGLREAPRGEVRVEVQFQLDSEGNLSVFAWDADTTGEISIDPPSIPLG